MKRTYCKPKVACVVVHAESGFMDCSVRVNARVTVEPYHDYGFTSSEGTSTDSWKIGFDEP